MPRLEAHVNWSLEPWWNQKSREFEATSHTELRDPPPPASPLIMLEELSCTYGRRPKALYRKQISCNLTLRSKKAQNCLLNPLSILTVELILIKQQGLPCSFTLTEKKNYPFLIPSIVSCLKSINIVAQILVLDRKGKFSKFYQHGTAYSSLFLRRASDLPPLPYSYSLPPTLRNIQGFTRFFSILHSGKG